MEQFYLYNERNSVVPKFNFVMFARENIWQTKLMLSYKSSLIALKIRDKYKSYESEPFLIIYIF